MVRSAVPVFTETFRRQTNKVLQVSLFFSLFILIVDSYFELFMRFYLSVNHSGFEPGESCINQLLSITHEIYSIFDNGFEVRSVFLDISKAFDKVWYEGIISELKQKRYFG